MAEEGNKEQDKRLVATPVPQVTREQILRQLAEQGMICTVPSAEVIDDWIRYAQYSCIKQLSDSKNSMFQKLISQEDDVRSFYSETARLGIRVFRQGTRLRLEKVTVTISPGGTSSQT